MMSMINPYVSAGRFESFDGETRLLPGITARPAAGHTPGHTVYLVESNGEKLLIAKDLVHVQAIQFADPSVTVQFDTDSVRLGSFDPGPNRPPARGCASAS
jgi:glyoxylase-like metal-dependent hydrolase (beta-lactamase superfamily II)